MPFTISHALYALPLRYLRASFLSATGLILGSMSPDMEYFISLEPYRSIGHTWHGFLLQALPLCISLAVVFHRIVKAPLAAHLPAAFDLNRRCHALFQKEQLTTWKNWLGFLLSVLLGFVTHIVLDSFTHAPNGLTHYFPWIWQTQLLGLTLNKLLQYSLSIIGLIGLLIWLVYALVRLQPNLEHKDSISLKQKLIYWSIVLLTSLVTTAIKLLLANSGNTLGILVVAPISGFIIGLVLASLIYKLRTGSKKK